MNNDILLKAARSKHDSIAAEFQKRLDGLPADARAADIQNLQTIYTNKLDKAEQEVRKLEAAAPTARISVTSEPATYHKDDASRSWVGDLYAVRKGGDSDALARLRRNDAEARALNSTTTTGGDFLPPIWAGQYYAEVKRARRVLSQLMRQLPLPPSGETITVPRMTAGAWPSATSQPNHRLAGATSVSQVLVDQRAHSKPARVGMWPGFTHCSHSAGAAILSRTCGASEGTVLPCGRIAQRRPVR